jgi:hypothetical protein
MSFGGGMCNICLAYLGLPVLTVSTTRAGDYIDQSAASVTGETTTTVRLHKENNAEGDLALNGLAGSSIERALSVYEQACTTLDALPHDASLLRAIARLILERRS